MRQLRRRLGAIDAAVAARIERLRTDRLEELGEALFEFTNPADLDHWLQSHAP